MKLFGTDGIRGMANQFPITAEVAMSVGRALVQTIRSHTKTEDSITQSSRRIKIVLGKDTRVSSYMLEQALAAGICSMGADVILLGPLPTPAVATLLKCLRADAGVMISASHNPYEYNGLKFFGL